MAFEEELSNVQVLYQLSWEGKLEHPHMITVQYPSNQDGLRLRDVKRRLTTLRGQGIDHSFSWSYKRNYRNTFIWNDLSDDDVIYPLRGSGEYLLKASELIDTFANKPDPESKFQNERKQSSADRHPRTMSVGYPSVGDLKKDESAKQGVVAIDTPQSLPPLSVEQETIDVEKSDFCLSSSDNEISPRPSKMADSSKPANNHGLAVMRKSPTVQGLQTPPPCNSPMEEPFSPGSAKRLWKREIRKSLFRPRNTNASSPSKKHENVCENPTVQGEAPVVESSHEDASLWKESRSKSVNTLDLKEKEVEQSTSQLIRLLWARWTGGSSRGKRIPNNTGDASPCKAARTPESTPSLSSRTKSPCIEEERFPTSEEISEQLSLRPATPRTPSNPPPVVEKEIVAVEAPTTQESRQPEELRLNRPALIVSELQVVLDTDTHEGGPPEAEIETPKPAIARVNFNNINTRNALPKVRTTVTSPRPLPPGFHKGTNDTKPVQTPRRNSRNNSIPLASPPLRRSMSRDAARSIGAIGVITCSPDQDSVSSTPSPKKLIKKCINFHERDERPLTPGLTTVDWEKALQAAVADCLPPPNFGQILQECSTCGRTFKPDSLQVHRRGCHPPAYSRAFSARASPHMIRTRFP